MADTINRRQRSIVHYTKELGCQLSFCIVTGARLVKCKIIYYQFAVKRGLSAPWTTKMKQAIDMIGGEAIQ
jgi:hypothetical protein